MSEKGRDLDQQKNQAHPRQRDRQRERERERDEETKKKIEPREGKMTITN